jgi:sodium-dependent dicarboxylate transporter 2/3/5
MLPVAFGLILQAGKDPYTQDQKNLRKALMLGIAYAATVGGMGTPVGTPANQQLLQYIQVSFARWVTAGLPCVVLLTTAAWFLLDRLFPLSPQSSFAGQKSIAIELEKMGSVSTREWRIVAIGVVTASMWVLRVPVIQSALLPVNLSNVKDGTIAMLMALACFIIPSGEGRGTHLMEARVISRVPWSVWLLFGGGLALAEGIRTSGLDQNMGLKLTDALAYLPHLKIAGAFAATAAGTILTQFSSNFSTAKILLPLLFRSIRSFPGDFQPVLMMAATLAVSCDFMFPFSTPPNAIVFGAGRLSIRDMLKAGFWLTLISMVVVAVCATWLLHAG